MEDKFLFKDNYYEFLYRNVTYEINQISPLLELKRYQLLQEIKKEINEYLRSKHINIDVNNLLPRWIMLQFNDKIYYPDPLFPYNGNNNSQLIEDIHYLSKKKISLHKASEISIKLDLLSKFNKAIDDLRLFIKSDLYINNFNNLVINTELKGNYYNFTIIFNKQLLENTLLSNLPMIIETNNLDYYKYNFKLNKKLVEKLINKASDKLLDFNDLFLQRFIVTLSIRYNTLESYNQQAAVLPELYQYFKDNYHVDFELFGSSFNCFYKHYCSLFYDLESYYGSKGNFFNVDIIKGFYVANPPFDATIMKNMSLKLVNSLSNSSEDLSVFITIPDWDKPEYGGFECLDILRKSGFIQYIETVDKHRVIFFDYYENKYKNLVGVNFILIQNKQGKKKYPIKKELKNVLLQFFPIKCKKF
jgi:phosphorylated CTD-interacting factor 1